MSNDDLVSVDVSSKEGKQLSLYATDNWQLPILVILFVAVVFISIKTVVNRHESRAAYMKLQKLEKERDRMAAQWSRLKLEQAVTLNQVRVERYARWDLNMKMPKASEIKIIQESERNNVVVANKSGNIKLPALSAKVATSTKVVLGN